MENNIEDLIKEEFNKREINPSAISFDKLDEKLKDYIKTKRKKKIRFISYAASIVGILFITQIIMVTSDKPVNETDVSYEVIEDSNQIKAPIIKNDIPVAIDQTHSSSQEAQQSLPTQRLEKLSSTNERTTMPSFELVESRLKKSELTLTPDSSIQKIKPVFNDSITRYSISHEVSEEELNNLLAAANRSLSKRGNDSLNIDAQRMLYEIEVEINKPLPEKVLLTVKTSALTIKEIVKSKDNENK